MGSCKEMGKKLSDLIKVGDHIKYCAILISPNAPTLTRDISHLATAVVFASTHSLIRTRDIPSTAPKVTNLKQLEAAKVGNFRTVTGLVGKTALTEREKQLMAEVDVGGKGKDDMEIDSDDEVEVLPTGANKVDEVELKAANAQLETRIKDFNLKDLRKLMMTYNTHLASIKETTERKIDLTKITEGVNKDLGTVERLFLAIGRKVKVETKSMKVGQVFLSQQQVKNILEKGILAPEHVDRTAQEAAEAAKKAAVRKAAEEARKAAQEKAQAERAAALKAKQEKIAAEKAAAAKAKAEKEAAEKAAAEKAAAEKAAAQAALEADPLYHISQGNKLNKLCRSYMELLKKAATLEDIAKVQELPVDKVRSLLVEITKRCKDAPVVDGKRVGFKLHSFFMNSTWVAKICENGLE